MSLSCSEIVRQQAEYSHHVHVETVYNQLFAMLPIYPYRLRRAVARAMTTYLTPAAPVYYIPWQEMKER